MSLSREEMSLQRVLSYFLFFLLFYAVNFDRRTVLILSDQFQCVCVCGGGGGGVSLSLCVSMCGYFLCALHSCNCSNVFNIFLSVARVCIVMQYSSAGGIMFHYVSALCNTLVSCGTPPTNSFTPHRQPWVC